MSRRLTTVALACVALHANTGCRPTEASAALEEPAAGPAPEPSPAIPDAPGGGNDAPQNPFVTRDNRVVPLPELKPGISRVRPCADGPLGLNQECASIDEIAQFKETTAVSFKFHQAQNPTAGTLSRRDFHPKQHACVAARFQVLDKLPANLRKGMFAKPGTYSAVMRFSNGSPQVVQPNQPIVMKPDKMPDSRGLAIKVVGVPGEPIFNQDATVAGQTTQDFLMINFPAFFLRKADRYADALRAMATGPAFIQILDDLEKRNLIGGQKVVQNVFAERYWSETPYRLGQEQAIKYSVQPCSAAQPWPLTDADTANNDFLRARADEKLRAGDQCMTLSVQVQKNPETMPIEDAAVDWPEAQSGFVPVARLTMVRGQDINDQARDEFCQHLSFNPWNSTVDHAPMGGINRARLLVYAGISRKRRMENGTDGNPQFAEPTPDHEFFQVLNRKK